MVFRFALIFNSLFALAVLAYTIQGGALLNNSANENYYTTAGATIQVPARLPLEFVDDAKVMFFVGIDIGHTPKCPNTLAVGITYHVNPLGGQSFQPWYALQLADAPPIPIDGVSIAGGDTVRLAVSYDAPELGQVWVYNAANGQLANFAVNPTIGFCGTSAGWTVAPVDLETVVANFGTVSFTNAAAEGRGRGEIYRPGEGAVVSDMSNLIGVLKATTKVDEDTVTFQYVGE